MGLWYRIAAVTFIGGSLADVGGHNPFEPALLGCAILHGPHVRNFIDAYRRLAIADAAVLVRSEDELSEALVATMAPDRAAAMAAAAWEVVQRGRGGHRHGDGGDRRLPRPQGADAGAALLGQPAGAPRARGAAAGAARRRSGHGRRGGGWRAARARASGCR